MLICLKNSQNQRQPNTHTHTIADRLCSMQEGSYAVCSAQCAVQYRVGIIDTLDSAWLPAAQATGFPILTTPDST